MLIEHTFESAKKSKFIDNIILSSESEKIINLAKKKLATMFLLKDPKIYLKTILML